MKQRMFCCVLSSAWKLSSYTYDYYVIFVQAGVYDKVYLFGNKNIYIVHEKGSRPMYGSLWLLKIPCCTQLNIEFSNEKLQLSRIQLCKSYIVLSGRPLY